MTHHGSARSDDGSVRVLASSVGLPSAVELTPAALALGEAALAELVLRTCRTAGARAAAGLRADLAAAGVPDRTLDDVGLPRRADLAEDAAPSSWLERS